MSSPCVDGTRVCNVGLPLFVARGLGLKVYFSGYCCDRGHRDFRRTHDKECVECRRVEHRRWKKRNVVVIRAQEQRRRMKPHVRLLERARERARSAAMTPEQRKAKRLRWLLVWKANDLEGWRQYRKAKRARHRRRRRGVVGTHTLADVRAIYKAQRGRCAYYRICGNRLGTDYHEDHIVPLAKGGTNDRSNIQLACPACNWKKRDKHPVEFAQSLGLLL